MNACCHIALMALFALAGWQIEITVRVRISQLPPETVPMTGDFNGDARVDLDDYRMLWWSWHLSGPGGLYEQWPEWYLHTAEGWRPYPLFGDLDGDRDVDLADFAVWQNAAKR